MSKTVRKIYLHKKYTITRGVKIERSIEMERFFVYCLDLFITAIAYLLVPTIFCVCRKKFRLSQIKLITIVNGICVWLAFMIIRINAGIDGTSYAVVLWSSIAYFLMKKHCLKDIDDNKPIKKYVITQVKKTNLPNTQPRKPKKKKQPLIFVTIALLILLIGSVTYNVCQYIAIRNYMPLYIGAYDGGILRSYKYNYITNKYLDDNGNEYQKEKHSTGVEKDE